MNNYPEWLKDDQKALYDKVSNLPEEIRNESEFHLMLYNPNYENVGNYGTAKDKMEVGQEYILGRAHTSGDYEGHISWRKFTPLSPEDITRALYHGIWYVMKKK